MSDSLLAHALAWSAGEMSSPFGNGSDDETRTISDWKPRRSSADMPRLSTTPPSANLMTPAFGTSAVKGACE
jgi:hypothetical protein